MAETINDVLARMRAIDAALPDTDGAAVFNHMYLGVTEQIGRRLGDGFFADPPFMTRLDVIFANRWLDAYDAADADKPVTQAWDPVFDARPVSQLIYPVQFALAGMNAHINYDLAHAVVATCLEFGVEPESGTIHADYQKINQLLAEGESEVRRSFLTEVGQAVDDRIGWAVHLISSWKIERARDAAWVNALTLWELRGTLLIGPQFDRSLGRMVGMAGRLLLTPAP